MTGTEDVPVVELFDSDQGLIFSFIPSVSSPKLSPKPEPNTLQPERETQQETTQSDAETPAPEQAESENGTQPDTMSAQ